MKNAWRTLTPTLYQQHQHWMQYALNLAEEAGKVGEIPVGAVIVDGQNNCIAATANRKERDQNPTSHAEILAITQATQKKGQWRLSDCTLYVTLEPCPMCAGAILQARIGLLVYGADDPKTGAIRTVANLPDSPLSNHHLDVLGSILGDICQAKLQNWFKQKR